MAGTVQWLRSVLFIAQMYLAMPLFAIVFTPFALFSRPAAFAACHAYCRWVRWTARWMVGLRSEVRGTPPQGEALIAAKHHSFFDIILLFSALPRAKFIMKKELKWAPILGWYALRIGCVPVDRGKRGQAITAMMQAVQDGRQDPGQLIIYPEGTRTAPGAPPAYKVGSAVLYAQLGQDCVPAATNVGVFWPRHGFYRKPGLAVVEFLPPIAPGLPNDGFMAELERRIETASDALMAEAGFQPPAADHGEPHRDGRGAMKKGTSSR
ncbi:MAG: 1-acyl-sn-glycerol-3-phosphate acyltransferase [Rhodobacter sp.]|jgi:1-acyl-sn-glycerol-3-phosphate acyltransferase|nr:1-acyl-sn-glycerol-3-phosphate acyltransferase [Rhodobacter sp.]